MDTGTLVSFLCAGFAALVNAIANVTQRKANREQVVAEPAGTRRRFGARLLWEVVRRPIWLLGFGGMIAAFALQAVALGVGQVTAVEAIIALEVPLTLLVASGVFRARVGRSEWSAILIMTAGLIALVAALDPRPGAEADVPRTTYALGGGATAVTIAFLVLAGRRGHGIWRTACLGAATGASFGLTATLIKETTAQLSRHGVVGVVSTWQTYVAIGFGLAGMILMQWALHLGPLIAAQSGFTLMDPLVSIFWGVLVYHELTRAGLWLIPAALSALAIGIGVVLLARSPLLVALNEHDGAEPGRERPAPVAPVCADGGGQLPRAATLPGEWVVNPS